MSLKNCIFGIEDATNEQMILICLEQYVVIIYVHIDISVTKWLNDHIYIYIYHTKASRPCLSEKASLIRLVLYNVAAAIGTHLFSTTFTHHH